MPPPDQLGGQAPQRLGRPPQRRLRVTAFIRLNQRQQRRDQPGIQLCGALAPPALASGTADRERILALLQLEDALADGALAHPRHLGNGPDPAMPQQPCLGRQQQPPLPLVQMRQQHLEPQRQLIPGFGQDRHTATSNPRPRTTVLFLYNFDYHRNLLTQVPKSAQPWVSTLVRTIFEQPGPDSVRAQHGQVVAALEAKLPAAAAHLDEARDDILAFTAFPREVWRQIWSNNPQERLNKEIRRRTDVVGIFPGRDAIIRLVGAVLAEQNDEWTESRRYMGLEILAACRKAGQPDMGQDITSEAGLTAEAISA